MSVRCGIGYDLHRLEAGRKLIVGGIELAFDKGPAGHSDGEVLAHALCDALLGAAGLGDIGTHFPDTDPKWKGANSLIFLEHAKKLLAERNFAIEHVDAVVILERPKLGPHFPKMREALANIQSGEYAKSFILESRAGAPTLLSRRRMTALHPIEQVGTKLREMMPWISKNKLVDQSRN